MVRSTGSQPRIRVKVRGSKWHAAEAEDWGNREAYTGTVTGEKERAGEAGGGWGDHSPRDPVTGIRG
jgi:hypothetical protein